MLNREGRDPGIIGWDWTTRPLQRDPQHGVLPGRRVRDVEHLEFRQVLIEPRLVTGPVP